MKKRERETKCTQTHTCEAFLLLLFLYLGYKNNIVIDFVVVFFSFLWGLSKSVFFVFQGVFEKQRGQIEMKYVKKKVVEFDTKIIYWFCCCCFYYCC